MTAGSVCRALPVLRMKRLVGAMNRRIAGSIDALGRLVGPIAACTVAPAIGVRPVSGLANVNTSALGNTASDLACRRIDASIDSRARDSRALALSTAPTCCQHAVINDSCSRRTTSAPSPAATRARGSTLTSANQPSSRSPTWNRFAGQAPYSGGPTAPSSASVPDGSAMSSSNVAEWLAEVGRDLGEHAVVLPRGHATRHPSR